MIKDDNKVINRHEDDMNGHIYTYFNEVNASTNEDGKRCFDNYNKFVDVQRRETVDVDCPSCQSRRLPYACNGHNWTLSRSGIGFVS